MLATIAVSVIAFASTNVDDIFVLLGFFADPAFRARHVVLGQYLGIGTLVAVSLVCSLIALVIPPAYIGLLGLLPMGIGAKKLWEAWRGGEDGEEERHPAPGAHKILSVAAVTIANGGDNIGVYVPMLATRSVNETLVLVAVFAVMTALWCFVAHFLVNHRSLGAPIRRYGHLVLPWVLIAIGIGILLESDAFSVFTQTQSTST
ncbi:MAG TPA: cadmium resistance transporter [Myxococcaceae bacterium]|nr:cadmium resistance transporter [Myxococcaceae bacterium]